MTVLVTGGTGLVGRFIVEGLLEAGRDVAVAGRTAPEDGTFSRPVDFRRLDLDPKADYDALFPGIRHLVHAAFHHVPGRYRGGEGDDPAGFVRLNRDGSIVLCKAAKAAGVARAIFLSSRAVYGTQPPGTLLSEDTECRPDTLYGQVKLSTEQGIAALADDRFGVTSLRVTGVYGAPRPGHPHKWEELFENYRSGKTIAPRAGTEVHGRDVAAAVLIALDANPQPRLLNVSDLLVDRHDLLRIVQAQTGCRHALPERAKSAGYNAMEVERLKALGWKSGGRPLLRRTVEELLVDDPIR